MYGISGDFPNIFGDLSENKRNQMKTNEKLIEFIFISFSMMARGGRELRPQGANFNRITLNAILDV